MSSAIEQGSHGLQMMKFIEIDIHAVHESTHNPRRHFDEAQLAQLAENIGQVGILTPLLVRPDPQGTAKQPSYEIAAGHRRYRAAKLAKLALVPCLVRAMDDQQFMECLNIENLQREGLHPLDEAKGYEALMAAPYKMTVQTIADKVGRSVKYIYDRVKLLDLTETVQELFWDGTITAGHAIILARLTSAEQARCLEDDKEGLLQPDHGLFDPLDERVDDDDQVKACSVRELQAWVDRRVRFNPHQADAMLFPETVQLVDEASELQRKIVPITYEYLVHEDVRNAERVYGERSWKRADGARESKVCERAVLGVVASGPHRGDAFDVCIDKKKCLVHWKEEVKAAEKKAKVKPNSPAAKAAVEREAQAWKKQQEQREARRKHWAKMTPKIEAAVMVQVKVLSAASVSVLGDLLMQSICRYGQKKKTTIPRGTTSEDLVRHLAGLMLAGAITEWDAPEKFPATAKALGVDLSPFVQLAAKAKGKAA